MVTAASYLPEWFTILYSDQTQGHKKPHPSTTTPDISSDFLLLPK